MAILLTLLFVTSVQAEDARFEKLRLESAMPAIAGAYNKSGIVTSYVSGFRKNGDLTKVKSGDKFHFGSCGKSMTATLAAIFIERGLLKWETTLGEIFGDVHAEYKNVTIDKLTSHRSGITGDISFGGGQLWKSLWNPKLDPSEGRKLVATEILKIKPASPPGSKFEYSNFGYVVLGAVLEKITKKSWEQLMRDELFAPLKMTSCGFGAAASVTAIPDQPWGHLENGTPVAPGFNGDNPPTIAPAGGIHCSMSDWSKFLAVHMDGFNQKSTKILKPQSFKKLHTVYESDSYTYGGWIKYERTWAGGPVLFHNGSNTMNYSEVWLAPKKNLSIIGVSNIAHAKAKTGISDLIGILLKEAAVKITTPKRADVIPPTCPIF